MKERIIETVEDACARGASDQEIDKALHGIGCTWAVRRPGMMIVYYDDQGIEQFIVLCGPVIQGLCHRWFGP